MSSLDVCIQISWCVRMCCDGGPGSPATAGQQDSAGAAAGQVSVSTQADTGDMYL